MNANIYLLKTLLTEYARQFRESLEVAQKTLEEKGEIEPVRKKVWISTPTHPALENLTEVLNRFAEFVDGLDSKSAAGEQ